MEHTELRVWAIDLTDSYPDMTAEMKECFRVIVKSNAPVSINAIKAITGYTDYSIRKYVAALEERKLVRKEGKGSKTVYIPNVDSIEMLTKLQLMIERIKTVL